MRHYKVNPSISHHTCKVLIQLRRSPSAVSANIRKVPKSVSNPSFSQISPSLLATVIIGTSLKCMTCATLRKGRSAGA